MRQIIFKTFFFILLSFFFFNCATYWNNRRKDFQDIFTVGFEAPGFGAGLRVGPASVGLAFLGGETAPGKLDKGSGVGLRGGRFGFYKSQQLTFFLLGGETFYSDDVKYDSDGNPEIEKGLPKLNSERDNIKSHKSRYLTLYFDPIKDRRKEKRDDVKFAIIDELAKKTDDPAIKAYLPKREKKPHGYSKSYLFQVEIYAGIYYGLRLGFNFAELVDFILGFTTIDILDDDVN
ncbi:MAG: hypothetical protein L6Q54_01830 [Leptospiraceae bacterium]|nr:hypothetical protein [Leptospiraceae bacterium]MCK6379979.1 hypothetical protein [Leptospiraceae bacterium]NUM40060.1 hypothetical protein [Leptospiraceae bacterium]